MLSMPASTKAKIVPLTVAQVRAWAAAVQCETDQQRDYSLTHPAGGKVIALSQPRFCAVCGTDISHLKWSAKYCGAAHRNVAMRAYRGAATAKRHNPRLLRPVRAMILTQAGLGLRISELEGLRVQDVDFLRREVHVRVQLNRRRKLVDLKTKNSAGVVPLPERVAGVLAGQIRDFPPLADGVIFRQPNGALWNDGSQWAEYHRAAVAAGLPDGTSSHDLRHHYASVLLQRGESVAVVAERIRDTKEMVLSTYGHLMPNQEDRTRRAIDDAWTEDEDAVDGAAES